MIWTMAILIGLIAAGTIYLATRPDQPDLPKDPGTETKKEDTKNPQLEKTTETTSAQKTQKTGTTSSEKHGSSAPITLIITSEPAGAKIFDYKGSEIGTTPQNIPLQEGGVMVTYTLSMEGYEKGVLEQVIPEVDQHLKIPLHASLIELPKWTITSTPVAKVTIDKVEVCDKTPCEIQMSAEGLDKKEVVLTAKKYKRKTIKLSPEGGEVKVKLSKRKAKENKDDDFEIKIQ